MMTELTTQAMPPHWANWAIVSTSLVTRAVSSPRRDSLWSAMLSAWMWAKRGHPQVAQHQLGGLHQADVGGPCGHHHGDGHHERHQAGGRARTAAGTRWRPSTPLSRICWISTGVVSRPMATTTAMASVNARPRRSSGLARMPSAQDLGGLHRGGLDLLGQVIGQRVGGVVEQAGRLRARPICASSPSSRSDWSRSASRSLIEPPARTGAAVAVVERRRGPDLVGLDDRAA